MIANLVSIRATCIRKQVGAVLVRDGRILCSGYNGVPAGVQHCRECTKPEHGRCQKVLHAEAGLISYAAREGVSLVNSTLYVTLSPCIECAKLILNCGIVEVFYEEKYRDKSGIKYLKRNGVKVSEYKTT